MVLDDCPIADVTAERLERVLTPKVQGAWNLHLLTRDDPLDWFVLYSSVASTIGNPGQASYAAANSFLDLLAHYRRQQGLPAVTINWGAVADAGHLTDHESVAQHLARIGVRSVPVRRLLNTLSGLLAGHATQVAVHSMDWHRLSTFLPTLAGGSRLAALRGAQGTDSETLADDDGRSVRERLLAMPLAERRLWIQAVVQRELARLLGTAPEEIDTSRPVIDLGIDSLMAVELGVVLSKTIQMEVPTMTLLGGSSIAQFAATLCPVTDDVAADGAAALAPVAAGL
jgi:acyl carrier protein